MSSCPRRSTLLRQVAETAQHLVGKIRAEEAKGRHLSCGGPGGRLRWSTRTWYPQEMCSLFDAVEELEAFEEAQALKELAAARLSKRHAPEVSGAP